MIENFTSIIYLTILRLGFYYLEHATTIERFSISFKSFTIVTLLN